MIQTRLISIACACPTGSFGAPQRQATPRGDVNRKHPQQDSSKMNQTAVKVTDGANPGQARSGARRVSLRVVAACADVDPRPSLIPSSPMESSSENWQQVVDQVIDGDRVAFMKMSRAITGFLGSWRAFDFRDDWDDLVQEVVIATVEAVKAGKMKDPNAIIGYIRQTARFKFVDRIRLRQREAPDADAEVAADQRALHWPPESSPEANRGEVWGAVRKLPDKQQQALVRVYAEGRTYEEASQITNIPLGSLKRYLRLGLATLHQQLGLDEADS